MSRKAYPSDVSDDEWAFVAPYLTLMSEAAPQREHELREVFNGLRWIVRAGAAWRMMPNDLLPWHVVYDQTQRWLKAGVFEAMVHDLRALLRLAASMTATSAWSETGEGLTAITECAQCGLHCIPDEAGATKGERL